MSVMNEAPDRVPARFAFGSPEGGTSGKSRCGVPLPSAQLRGPPRLRQSVGALPGRDAAPSRCYEGGVTLSQEITEELAALAAEGLLRSRGDQAVRGSRREWVDVSSNDYLGLARESVSRETLDALAGLPVGSGASRLIHGTHRAHQDLEQLLADWVHQEDAVLFSSGYAANVGVLAGLTGPGDLVVSDALNHASIIDGCRLSRATVRIVPHADPDAVDHALRGPARRRWVVTESYFSMDGDTADLAALRHISDAHDAGLIVDEAHALGVFGPRGSGRCVAAGVRADVTVGALGKAVGLQGGFAAAAPAVVELLWNRARSLVFSTAPSPLLTALTALQVRRVQQAENRRLRLRELAGAFATSLADARVPTPSGRQGPIFPVLLRSNDHATHLAARLRAEGFLVQAIRPPTVPLGQARLRIALSAGHDPADLNRLARELARLCAASS
jgi:8-amino-7-oxononanoate synthase